MAIIKCPECGKEISDSAEKCIHCGFPINSEKKKEGNKKKIIPIVIVASIVAVIVLAIAIISIIVLVFGVAIFGNLSGKRKNFDSVINLSGMSDASTIKEALGDDYKRDSSSGEISDVYWNIDIDGFNCNYALYYDSVGRLTRTETYFWDMSSSQKDSLVNVLNEQFGQPFLDSDSGQAWIEKGKTIYLFTLDSNGNEVEVLTVEEK